MESIVFVYIFKAISIRLFAAVNSLLFIRECEWFCSYSTPYNNKKKS